MKHPFLSLRPFLLVGLAGCVTVSAAAQQSLGDAARKARQNRPAEPTTRVITNDDIATGASSSRAPETYNSTGSTAEEAGKSSPEAKTGDEPKTAGAAGDDPAKLDKDWQEKIGAQKEKVALLERELDVLQRENKLRASNYYSDAGSRLRDEKKYAEDDRKYRDQIAEKQKQIDDAKTKLEQMKDDARKAGASPSAIG
jgi:hypothetical protein